MGTAQLTFEDPRDPKIPLKARAFAEWYVTPTADREELTLNAWCDTNEVDRRDTLHWRQSAWWPALMQELSGDKYGFSALHDLEVLAALQKKAASGNVPAIAAYLAVRGIGYADKKVPAEGDLGVMTDDEVAARRKAVEEKRQAYAAGA